MNSPFWIAVVLPSLCALMVSAHPHPGMDVPHSLLSANFQQVPHLSKADGSMGVIHADSFGEGQPCLSWGFCSKWNPFWRLWAPEFLKNVSDEGLKKFCEIVSNGNFTKYDMEGQLGEWASWQGVYDEFKKYSDEMVEKDEKVASGMLEILANTTKFINDVQDIKKDMGLTKKEELRKLWTLIKETEWSSLHLAFVARKYAQYAVDNEHQGNGSPSGHSEAIGRSGPMGQGGPFGNHGPFNGLFGIGKYPHKAVIGGNPAQPDV